MAKDQDAAAIVRTFEAMREDLGRKTEGVELGDDRHVVLAEAENTVDGAVGLGEVSGLGVAAAEEDGSGGVERALVGGDGVEGEQVGDIEAGGAAAVAVLEGVVAEGGGGGGAEGLAGLQGGGAAVVSAGDLGGGGGLGGVEELHGDL